ncbi:hypothetical protein B0A48_09168 [Cryoendolithus antarcticus]|uniref:Major facilitator superfamily (MFS) profile domain-containing protein n=1 Tax=Cryoendolithus antarcticus TaxID=1507870 RepID=A0A1V8T239_9PEZI|nr:hypothetical protein B0A48_09168 [Cryoendolithus antarcticus]OQO32069.1 hypothetical protein B0A51_00607 [Rachicladosporium sp. CCFEE 5018]
MTDTDRDWPPGTIRLQTLLKSETNSTETEIILQPRPSDDPNDPLNWPKYQKVINFSLACFYAMMVFAFVNATSPTWGPLADELGFSSVTLTNTYAIGCATLALGAPMLIPFALKYGSRPVYVFSSIAQFGISIWAAKTQTAGDWWGVNAVQCWLGALAEVLIQMTIADVFFVHQRGTMNAIYIWVANVGGNLAVVASGFITQNQGWRWVWWWCAIFFGVQFLMFVFGFEETKFMHFETLEGRQGSVTSATAKNTIFNSEKGEKPAPESPASDFPPPAEVMRSSEPDAETRRKLSTIQIDHSKPRKTYVQRLNLLTTSEGPWVDFLRHSWQPFMILFTIPGVAYCSLVYGILLAWSTVMTTALSTYMLDAPYNFSASQIGLMSLAPFIGSTLGTIVVGPVSDFVALRLAKRNGGIYEPEMRFWVFLPFVPFQLAGAWWFAYALAGGAPWPQVAMAFGIANFGSGPLSSLALVYLLDAYNEIVGDALTALTVVRNTFSTIFVFAIPAWAAAVGLPNVFNTIGALGLVILSFAGAFIWKGKFWRYKFAKTYKYYADRQFEARPMS